MYQHLMTVEKGANKRKELKKYTWKEEVVPTLDYLFSNGPREQANNSLMQALEDVLEHPQSSTFEDMDKHPCKLIKIFYKLQCWAEETKNMKSFSMIPIYKHGRHHVRYDTEALHELLTSLKLPDIPQLAEFRKQKEVQWPKYFIHKYISYKEGSGKGKWFDNSINTDGVSLVLSMQRTRKSTEESQRRECDVPQDNDIVIGADPGARLMFGATVNRFETDAATTIKNERYLRNIKISSKEWRHNAGKFKRQRRLAKWTERIDEKSKTTLSPKYPTQRSDYIFHRLKFLKKKQAIYGQRKIARLKLQKYMHSVKAAHELAKKMLQLSLNEDNPNHLPPPPPPPQKTTTNQTDDGNTKPRTWLFLGSARMASNSPIKGYCRTPHALLRRVFAERMDCTLVMVDEYNTTKCIIYSILYSILYCIMLYCIVYHIV